MIFDTISLPLIEKLIFDAENEIVISPLVIALTNRITVLRGMIRLISGDDIGIALADSRIPSDATSVSVPSCTSKNRPFNCRPGPTE